MKRIKLLLASLAVAFGLGVAVPTVALATTPQETVCTTLQSNANCTEQPEDSVDLNEVIETIIDLLSIIIGIIAVIMIMVGGYKYVTSGGDSNKITSAKNTIIYAVIGLAVVALAQIIVWFVLRTLKGDSNSDSEETAAAALVAKLLS